MCRCRGGLPGGRTRGVVAMARLLEPAFIKVTARFPGTARYPHEDPPRFGTRVLTRPAAARHGHGAGPYGASAAEVAELTIFAWPGIVPDILKERSIAPFSKMAPGVTVKLDVATNAVMYPKMLAARSNPVVSGGMFNDIFLQKGIADRMWVEPNDDWMPNRKSVPTGLLAPGGQGTIFQFTPYG